LVLILLMLFTILICGWVFWSGVSHRPFLSERPMSFGVLSVGSIPGSYTPWSAQQRLLESNVHGVFYTYSTSILPRTLPWSSSRSGAPDTAQAPPVIHIIRSYPQRLWITSGAGIGTVSGPLFRTGCPPSRSATHRRNRG